MSSLAIIFETMRLSAVVFLIFIWWKHRDALTCQWDAVARFCAFMVFGTALRFAAMDLVPPSPLDGMMRFYNFPMVFWEDAFFGLSIWYVKEQLKLSKRWWMTWAITMSLLFASLHLGYGIPWAVVTLVYPYFISYRFGNKYGFKTVMVCHIIYDFLTLLAIKVFLTFPQIFMV